MKRLFNVLLVGLCVCCLAVGLSGCSGTQDIIGSTAMNDGLKGEGSYDSIYPENGNSAQSPDDDVKNNRKIIEKIYYSVETKEFDDFNNSVLDEVSKLGGYIENSEMSNRYARRTAQYVVRVPADKSALFSVFVSDNSNVLSKNVNTEDVTLKYVDIESRLSALHTERQTVENLLAKATDMNDVLTITKRLNEIIYQIDTYQSQLNTLKNQVDFTTITINIEEVEVETVVEELGVWEQIGHDFKTNAQNVWEGLVDLFVWFVGSLPVLCVYAVCALIAILIIRVSRKRAKHNASAKHYAHMDAQAVNTIAKEQEKQNTTEAKSAIQDKK